jgi:hypothetical protein
LQDKTARSVQEQYEAWPYPHIPLLMRARREDLWQLNLQWMQRQAHVRPQEGRARIWITGCGTFQPYVIALANPHAQIIATDISEQSLRLAKRRCGFYGIKNVRFEHVDLTVPETYPQGPFDWIESYGVLMCLPQPQETLNALVAHLTPQGLMRTMVYPHFSRRRVFQIQRLASLIGLTHEHPSHPQLLQKIMNRLPQSHPLHYAFSTYYDSQNPVGVVDAFLHASDRGFTGLEWAKMTGAAGLVPGFFLHRPWGQPHQMLSQLGFENIPLNMALHYLDAWQELRSNFIVTFKKDSAEELKEPAALKHPLFDWRNLPGSPFYRARLVKHAVLGTQVSSRTHEGPLKLSGKDVRSLLGWGGPSSSAHVERMMGTVSEPLNAPSWQADIAPYADYFSSPRIGKKVPNPFYGQHFDAWFLHRHFGEAYSWPDLKEEIDRWSGRASPLETDILPWGLTPHATYGRFEEDINGWLSREPLSAPQTTWAEVCLENEQDKRDQVRHWLSDFSGLRISGAPGVWRELWMLLFSYETLFLNLHES